MGLRHYDKNGKIDESFMGLASLSEIGRMVVEQVINIQLTGFYAYLIKVDDNYILVNRGSETEKLEDWIEDWGNQNVPTIFTMGLQDYTSYISTKCIFKDIVSDKEKLYITGHSLGGRLSLIEYYMSLKNGYGNKIERVVTFNGAGIPRTSIVTGLFDNIIHTDIGFLDPDEISLKLLFNKEKISEYGIAKDILTDDTIGKFIQHFSYTGFKRQSSYFEKCTCISHEGKKLGLCRHSMFHFFVNDTFI